jgi:hypothetical protein
MARQLQSDLIDILPVECDFWLEIVKLPAQA